MALNRPFMIILYWGGSIEYGNGCMKGDQSTLSSSDILRHKIRYEQFTDLVYAHLGVEKSAYKLNMSLCYQYCGRSNMAPLVNDSSLDMMYHLAENDENYCGQVCVDIEKILPPTNTGFVDLMRNFDVPFPLPNDDRFETTGDFGPVITAFQRCRLVICVDGTHLKGSYKGKMLVAVTKDANNHILPIAYAIVDEETVHSWCWFFDQFRRFVAQNRQLCVISDRHQGIIHAMENLQEWKEPLPSLLSPAHQK